MNSFQESEGLSPKTRNASKRRRNLLGVLAELMRTYILVGILVLILIGFGLLVIHFLLLSQQPETLLSYLILEIGTALLLGGLTTGLVRLFIVRYYDQFKGETQKFLEEDVTKSLTEIQGDITEQTEYLVSASASLEAMRGSGISQIYASRAVASKDIAQDLTHPNVSEIRVIGISLNDFVRADQSLNRAWTVVEGYIRGERSVSNVKHQLDIKALIIDPQCLGGQLRSQAEGRYPKARAGRLYSEVMSTAKHLAKLERIAKENCDHTCVSFEFRLCRSAPILFLCSTDTVSYVQQYYFWASRYADVPNPVVKYHGLSGSARSHSLHDEMRDHFDWIWDKASISSHDFLEGKSIGVDRGISQTGAINVFNDPGEARKRFLWLLKHAKSRLYIQGISLHSFFDYGNLFQAIARLVDRGDIDIKVLLLDPDSEQACYRSFREHLFLDPTMTFNDFRSDPALHRNSRLYRDTQTTIDNINNAIIRKAYLFSVGLDFVGELDTGQLSAQLRQQFLEHGEALASQAQVTVEQAGSEWTIVDAGKKYLILTKSENQTLTVYSKANDNFQMRLYSSAPACFMLMVDDSVLVEQYHYGKILPQGDQGDFPVILGKDMPLLEYTRTPSDLFDTDPFGIDPLRNPYKLLENHFAFIFEKCARLLQGG